MRKLLLLLTLLVSISSCDKKKQEAPAGCNVSSIEEGNKGRVSITQGVYGTIWFTEGNCMPGVGGTPDCRTCPVSRELRIYEYTVMNDVELSTKGGGFFSRFNTRLVATTRSDANGFFQLTLAPGTYTMAVVEDGLLYANRFDRGTGIFPISVGTGVSQEDFPITYKAVF
ncbi:hypothetical protein KJS94_11360 [Flavihumibacter rivuli]|uniref:hypothetical protein n=1 Tax=Flavihumibacter rivuli TaxID=2838156 RepID=UPI001BDF02EC|nr:hypothetical protein [Flavihumibacter rivuli]ULQ55240.1 hypothetical protein KJS94_11360 [Flavihumibacter rivuli]